MVEAEDAVVFGLQTALESVNRSAIIVRRAPQIRSSAERPLRPLTVYDEKMHETRGLRPGMTAAEVAAYLRETPPAEVDVKALLRRVRGD